MRKTAAALAVGSVMAVASFMTPSGQSGLEGSWVSTDFGPNPAAFVFSVQGSAVTGTMVGGNNQPRPIENGRIAGDTVTFTGTTATGGREVTFTGKITGDTIAFSRSVVVRDPGQNNGNGLLGAQGPVQFVVRRGTVPVPAPETPLRSTGLVTINDNRTAAGALSSGALTLRLEARAGEWHPDGDTDPGIVVNAFAVEGGQLQIPGPLVRVVEGTEVRVAIHNRLENKPLEMHGLYSRSEAPRDDVFSIPAGETREVRFMAGKPGTYYYWGTTTAGGPQLRPGSDSQLSGGFIVDPRGVAAAPDRVLVIGLWDTPAGRDPHRFVINGKSWPHTERLTYRVGDTVRMRIVNAGGAVHPMHLHGFYFNVDSRGDERSDAVLGPGAPPRLAVTERLEPGRTFSLTWLPTRPGNWLFHCHDNAHLVQGGPLDGSARVVPPPAHHVENHAMEMMAGPVMGITVTGSSTEAAPSPSLPRRQLRLVARVDAGGTDAEPAYGYTLDDPKAPAPSRPYLPGPTLVLKRGEPVTVTVVNRLPEPTAVHWHGIELESYYDGVAGFSGQDGRISPAIPPGESFEARFTPPRSGTFIYHTHIDEVRQQQAGLSGPLVVVDSLESYDPEHNVIVMVTVPRNAANGNVVLVNGSSTPPERIFRAGERYRFRFINIHVSRPSMRIRLLDDSGLLTWRAVAKDGRDLPPESTVVGPSEIQMGNGETYDFEFVPAATGQLRLDVTASGGSLLSMMPIRVR